MACFAVIVPKMVTPYHLGVVGILIMVPSQVSNLSSEPFTAFAFWGKRLVKISVQRSFLTNQCPSYVDTCNHFMPSRRQIVIILDSLTCGMFMRDAVELPCPDSAAGLYIKTRTGQIVKVVYGEDQIAYQIGETTEILSRGHVCATPHCVQAPKGEEASGLERSTFALFMQPDWYVH
ncbi:unnamed protein product [Ilex paraguariensis]|uniref:Isopenicillin N synthase-like Fe(2+) 2OG dioxygenase domain-containing protein n=1 Tax=Ilex paraguariensis TaxID=185542 RepID=A0ABC8SB70_9AQUA